MQFRLVEIGIGDHVAGGILLMRRIHLVQGDHVEIAVADGLIEGVSGILQIAVRDLLLKAIHKHGDDRVFRHGSIAGDEFIILKSHAAAFSYEKIDQAQIMVVFAAAAQDGIADEDGLRIGRMGMAAEDHIDPRDFLGQVDIFAGLSVSVRAAVGQADDHGYDPQEVHGTDHSNGCIYVVVFSDVQPVRCRFFRQ